MVETTPAALECNDRGDSAVVLQTSVSGSDFAVWSWAANADQSCSATAPTTSNLLYTLQQPPAVSTCVSDDAFQRFPPPTDFQKPPEDAKHIVRMIFFLQGISMLFPWNTYITANAYFSHRFQGTHHEHNFENAFSAATMLASMTGFIIAMRASKGNQFNMRASVAVPMMIIMATLASSTLLVLQDDMDPNNLFWLTLASVAVCGSNSAFLQMGIFGLAARFPPRMTHAVLAGQGTAGIVISLVSLLTTLSEHSEEDLTSAAFAYFLIATSVVLVTLFALCLMSRLEFAVYYAFGEGWLDSPKGACVTPPSPVQLRFSPDSETPPTTPGGEVRNLHQVLLGAEHPTTQSKVSLFCCWCSGGSPGRFSLRRKPSKRHSLLSYKRDILDSPVCTPAGSPAFRRSPDERSSSVSPCVSDLDLDPVDMPFSELLKRISPSVATVIMTFLVTLTVFPAMLAKIHPATSPNDAGRIFGDLWVPLLFLTFNVGDTAGRVLSSAIAARPRFTGLFALSRVTLIPLLTVVASSSHNLQGLWAHFHDAGSVALVALLALSNGSAGGAAMIHGPSCVPKDFRSRAGTVMAFSMQTGLLIGSANSFIVRAWRCNCNAFLQ